MPDAILWSARSGDMALPEGEIHIWRVNLDLKPAALDRLKAGLAPDEASRAARFHFARDRDRFIASRGALRQVLGAYMSISPGAIEFCYGIHGKPGLRVGDSQPPIRFNIAHAEALAVFGFARGRDIGIDVEPIATAVPGEEIAARYFSAQELAELRALQPGQRAEGFSLGWTRKEAYAKARGLGLQITLDSFSVSLTPGQPERLQSEDSSRWTLQSFRPASNFVAAIVSEGPKCEVRFWDWTF
jgi:4'-phosphopantetheinyl transferase